MVHNHGSVHGFVHSFVHGLVYCLVHGLVSGTWFMVHKILMSAPVPLELIGDLNWV